jgi:hypothetical protein
MKPQSVGILLGTLMLLILVGEVRAQEAEVVTQIGKEIVEALGGRVPEYGGKEAIEQTAERLVVQAGESAGQIVLVTRDALLFKKCLYSVAHYIVALAFLCHQVGLCHITAFNCMKCSIKAAFECSAR